MVFKTNVDLNASNEEVGDDVGEIKINELALSDKEKEILYPSVGVTSTTESVFTLVATPPCSPSCNIESLFISNFFNSGLEP